MNALNDDSNRRRAWIVSQPEFTDAQATERRAAARCELACTKFSEAYDRLRDVERQLGEQYDRNRPKRSRS
jgi:hypothetical protein